MGKSSDTYKETKEFQFPNMTVRVHIPNLTADEKNRRMKAVYQAASELLKSKTKE